MEENLLDKVSVNSFGINAEGSVDDSAIKKEVEKENEIKEKLSEEDMQKLQEEFKKEADRLQEKYQIASAEVAETISVEDVDPIEAMRILEDKEDLFAFTELMDGLGLSASQLGIGKKYFVARDMSVENNPFKIYFNPKYYQNGSTRITFNEGCLTYPGKQVPVKRYKNITFHWFGFDENGEWKKFKKNIKGLNSIILQHETCHCGGHPWGNGKTPETIMTIQRKKGRAGSSKDYIK